MSSSDDEDNIEVAAQKGITWTNEATEELLKILELNFLLFNSGKIVSKKALYDKCSREMNKLGHAYSGNQCANRWKHLKRRWANHKRKRISGLEYRRNYGENPALDDAILVLMQMDSKEQDYESLNLNVTPGFDTPSSDKPKVKNELLKANNDQQGQMASIVNDIRKNKEKIEEIDQKSLDKDDDLLKQSKITSSLLMKLIQKIG